MGNGKAHLNKERKAPRPFTRNVSCTIGDVESNHNGSDNSKFLQNKQSTTNLRRRNFRNIKRCHHGQHADTNTSDEPGTYKHFETHSPSLQGGTKEEDYHRDHDGPLPRDFVGNPSLVHCSNERPQLDHGREDSFLESCTGCVGANLGKSLEKLVHCEGYGDDTLVVAEHCPAQCCEGCACCYIFVREDTLQACFEGGCISM